MNKVTVLLSSVAMASALAFPAFAHHGWGGQESGQFELSGKLHRDVNLAGPHGSMQLIDDKGQVWEITLAPPARVERSGLKAGVIPMGAPISISGHRASDSKKLEVKTERVTWNGRNFDVYPDRL